MRFLRRWRVWDKCWCRLRRPASISSTPICVRGRYPAALPFVPGQEAAGVVAAVGEGVTGFREGDRVAWNGTRGTYAEYACAPASDLLHVPDEVSFEQAAAALLLQGLDCALSGV